MTTVAIATYARTHATSFDWLLNGACTKAFPAALKPGVGWEADDAAISAWLANNPAPPVISIPLPADVLAYAVATGGVTASNGVVDPTAQRAWLNAWRKQPPANIPRATFVARFDPAAQLAIASFPQGVVWWLTLADYPTINLRDFRVVAGVQALVGAKALTQAQAAVILTP